MDVPPSRYRVEERGRRLIVIDRTTGRQVSSPSPRPLAGGEDASKRRRQNPAPPPSTAKGVQPWRLGLKKPQATPDSFVTRNWFDAKAPRAIKLNYRTRSQLDLVRMFGAIAIAVAVAGSFLFWPWFVILLAGLLAPQKARSRLRDASTRWIDGLDQAD